MHLLGCVHILIKVYFKGQALYYTHYSVGIVWHIFALTNITSLKTLQLHIF